MATVVGSVAGGAWNTNGAWLLGVQPTAADDVQLNATVGSISLPTATTVVCRSLDCTGYTNTLTFASTTAQISIGDGTAGASNIALKLVSGMTVTLTGTGTINFISTSATQQTITTGTKVLPNLTFTGVGSSYQLQDALSTFGGNTSITHTNGTLDTNGQAVTTAFWSGTGSAARTLTLGSSSITCVVAGGTYWNYATTTLLTMTANTATLTANGGTNVTFSTSSGFNWNGLSLVVSNTGNSIINNSCTVANYTRTGGAAKTDQVILTGTLTCSSTFTVNSNSLTNRVLVNSAAVGTTATVSAATVVLGNVVDFMDITGSGAATWTGAGTGATGIGDCQGNSGITFTGAVTRYGVTAGSWSSTGVWSTSSGGATGASVPLPQDTVLLDASSGAGTYTVDMPRAFKDLTCTGFTRTFTSSVNFSLFGSVTLVSGMTLSSPGAVTFAGRSSHTVTSAGKSLNTCTFAGFGGTYTLSDAFTLSAGSTLAVTAGGIATAGFTVTTPAFSTSGTITRSINITSSTITLTGTSGTPWSIAATGLTFTSTGSTITYSTVATVTRTFAGASLTYATVTYNVANSSGALTITGTNYFDTINVGSGRTINYPQSVVTTVRSHNPNGAVNGYIRLNSGGTSGHYISQPDSTQLSFASDFTLLARVALDDWTPSAINALVGKYGALGNRSYMLSIDTAGKVNLSVSADGTNSTVAVSSAATGFTDGTTNWVLATWRASDGRTQFYTASGSIANPAASDFTQLGTNQTANVGSIFDSTNIVEYGSVITGSFNFFVGNYYRGKIYDGLFTTSAFGGTLQADVNAVGKTVGANTFTESSANGATVTITGALAQVGDGRVAVASASGGTPAYLELFGAPSTMDYLTVQDIFSTLPYKFYAGANSTSVSGNTNVTLSAVVAGPSIYKQAEQSTASTSVTATIPFSLTATTGNMLFASLGVTANPGTVNTPSGWTLIDSSTQPTTAYNYTFYKVSTGGETGVTITYGNSTTGIVKVYEIGGFTGTATFDVKDKNGTAGAASLTTGSGVSNTASPAIAIGVWQAANTMGNTVSFSNNFQEQREASQQSTARWAALLLTSNASQTTLNTWTTSRVAVSQLVIFKDVTAVTSTGNFFLMF